MTCAPFNAAVFTDEVCQGVRSELGRSYPSKPGAVESPVMEALRSFVGALPCPIEVLRVQVDLGRGNSNPATHFTYVRLDLSRMGQSDARMVADLRQSELDSHRALLEPRFATDDNGAEWGHFRDLTLMGMWPSSGTPDWCVIGVPFDALSGPLDLGREIFQTIESTPRDVFLRKYDPTIDFAKEYGLRPLPPMTSEQLMSPSLTCSRDFKGDECPDARGVAAAYRNLSHAVLIPKVPEDIDRTFEMARDLLVFSALRHPFATIGEHYLYLAVEAAIKTRWMRTLGDPVEIVGKHGQARRLNRPTHSCLVSYWRTKARRWTPRRLAQAGRPLPVTMSDLIKSLMDEGIVTPWIADRLRLSMFFRNEYSHRESGILTCGGIGNFERAAYLINVLFHSTQGVAGVASH